MASVNVFTAERMQAIEDGTVVNGSVDGTSGHLILEHHDSSTSDAGKVTAENLADADHTTKGIVELATSAETITGTDDVRAITPKDLADIFADSSIASTTAKRGLIELATSVEAIAGTDADRAISPLTLGDTLTDRFSAPLSRLTALEARDISGWVPVYPSSIGVSGTSPVASISTSGMVTFSNVSSMTLNGIYNQSKFKRFHHFWICSSLTGQYLAFRFTSGGIATTTAAYYIGSWYRQASSVSVTNVTNGIADIIMGYLQAPSEGDFQVSYPADNVYLPQVRGRFQYSNTNITDSLAAGMWNGPGGPTNGNFDGARFASLSGGLFSGELITYGLAS